MARKKNIPEEEIVNVTCEEAAPAEETLVDTTPPDETGADTGSFSISGFCAAARLRRRPTRPALGRGAAALSSCVPLSVNLFKRKD